jgi:hypothetical protein
MSRWYGLGQVFCPRSGLENFLLFGVWPGVKEES